MGMIPPGWVHLGGNTTPKNGIKVVGRDILRRLDGVGFRQAWYLCDLKVHPAHRGQHLPLRIFRRVFLSNNL